MKVKVDICVACSSYQASVWWLPLIDSIRHSISAGIDVANVMAISSAVPDHNKNHSISSSPFANVEEKGRNKLTDANRVTAVRRFMNSGSDYLFFVDDDTVHEPNTLPHLLHLAKEMVGGVYFNPAPPHNPIAYIRRPDGLYHAFYGYAPGTLVQVDSIGMGCTLIHRSVFERIQAAHTVFQRPNGSLIAIENSKVLKDPYQPDLTKETVVVNNVLKMPLRELEHLENDDRPWPFYALEYGRTEDHAFCELASHVNIRPWLDTNVICKHFKMLAVGLPHYEVALSEKMDELLEVPDANP